MEPVIKVTDDCNPARHSGVVVLVCGAMNMEISNEALKEALQEVIDPELGINIVDLGLVYDSRVSGDRVEIKMTMTTPACPLHAYMDRSVREVISEYFPAIKSVKVDLVWDPPWHPRMMSTEAKLQLGWNVMNHFSLGGAK
jgi:metal-sulfur cluster biosynthetic enzyme